MLRLRADNYSEVPGHHSVALDCPSCGKGGTFEHVNATDFIIRRNEYNYYVMDRRCPNPDCYAYILIIQKSGTNEIVATFPSQMIDFKSAGIPEKILKLFEEVLICHSNQCFVAAAIMIRRTLEEICAERGAKGKTLHDRITALKTLVTLPPALIDGLNEIKLLGNDAAHVDAKTYDEIGKDEVEAIIELTKEILKSLYQLDSLMNKLNALKNKKTPASP